MLRANMVKEAEEMCQKFTREGKFIETWDESKMLTWMILIQRQLNEFSQNII